MKQVLVSCIFTISLITGAYWYLSNENQPTFDGPLPRWGGGSPVTQAEPLGSMVWVPGGAYTLGDEFPEAREDAERIEVTVRPFLIDRYQVTNEQFQTFVEATGYETTAEREGGGWAYVAGAKEWEFVSNADWRHPTGPKSSIKAAMNHPVVLVSWEDAKAYANWAEKRLPTEAEWEVAARGARSMGAMPVQDPSDEDVTPFANVWQGHWPEDNLLTDGYFYTAPVGAYPSNPLGVDGMIGNAWEWTADWYTADNTYRRAHNDNPQGPPTGDMRVARGGSWFCSDNYCAAYKPGFRGKSPPTHAFNNVGFRCAKDAS